jgi:hypothetical protein
MYLDFMLNVIPDLIRNLQPTEKDPGLRRDDNKPKPSS